MTNVNLRIRPGGRKDIKEVVKIEELCFGAEAYPNYVFNYFVDGRSYLFLVAEYDNRVVGYMVAEKRGEGGLIVSLAVHPHYRGKGIGSALLRETIKILREEGIKGVSLQVKRGNLDAISLYSAFGFKIIRVLRKYYIDGSDAYLMEKELI